MKNTKHKGIIRLIKTITIILAVYLFLCVVLYFLQDRLIFSLAYNPCEPCDWVKTTTDYEPIELTMSDGCVLRGYATASFEERKNIVLYFGANAEDITYLPEKANEIKDYSFVFLFYRGYGESDGTPSDKQLYKDSEEIYDAIIANSGINYDNVVVIGRSIGSSVATYLTSVREVSSTILISPFDSMSHIVSSKCPIFPLGIMLKHKFPTIEFAPNVTSHVDVMAGTDDWLVPTSLTRTLINKLAGEVTYTVISGVGHNTIDDSEEYWPTIDSLLPRN